MLPTKDTFRTLARAFATSLDTFLPPTVVDVSTSSRILTTIPGLRGRADFPSDGAGVSVGVGVASGAGVGAGAGSGVNVGIGVGVVAGVGVGVVTGADSGKSEDCEGF